MITCLLNKDDVNYYGHNFSKDDPMCIPEREEDGTVHDPYRIDCMRQHLQEMGKAIEDGVDLIGYTAWGCIDFVSASPRGLFSYTPDHKKTGSSAMETARFHS